MSNKVNLSYMEKVIMKYEVKSNKFEKRKLVKLLFSKR